MKNDFIKLLSVSLLILISFNINAQTLATDTFSQANGNLPSVGSSFNVPIYVTGVGDVITFTVVFKYDEDILVYDSLANNSYGGNVSVQEETGKLTIILDGGGGFPPQTVTVQDGKFLDIAFKYRGGNTDLTFGTNDECSFLDGNYVEYFFTNADVTNGAVVGTGAFVDNEISGGDWNDDANWTLGVVPNSWHNVTVKTTPKGEVTLTSDATVHNLTIEEGGELTVSAALTVNGNLTVNSSASGDGSLVYASGNVTVNGTSTVQRYIPTTQNWYGISAPVSGVTLTQCYFNGNPSVWVKKYVESTDSYEYMTDLTDALSPMTGYFTYIGSGSGLLTFNFTGSLNTGDVSNNSLTNTLYGFNFVGNPYPSSIDWDAASGWTKTNLDDATYIYNSSTGNWQIYSNGAGVNGGTATIAMGQGFFVKVSSGNATGAIKVGTGAMVHGTTGFTKDVNFDQQIVRLQLTSQNKSDETVVRFTDEATADFDSQFDAVKMFSFNEENPQIYTLADQEMAINSLPFSEGFAIPLNVKGKDGDMMTISLTECDIDQLYLRDNLTGDIIDLTSDSYTFENVNTTDNRFDLLYGITGIEEPVATSDIRVFAIDRNIRVELNDVDHANISVYNLLGQVVKTLSTNNNHVMISVPEKGFYLVKVDDGVNVTTKKVLIN